MYEHLPGGELLEKGLKDLEGGVKSVEASLVLIGASRLLSCGVNIPQAIPSTDLPEHELYRQLRAQHGPEAYRHYRSLIRRLVSLENALDALAWRSR